MSAPPRSLIKKAEIESVRQCLSCGKMYEDMKAEYEEKGEVMPDWVQVVRTVKLAYPHTIRKVNGQEKILSAETARVGETCRRCFDTINEAPDGQNPGFG